MSRSDDLASIEEVIEEAKAGRMFILVDDEGRENEGDLVIPAEKADAGAVNFMAKYGRGLICLALTGERVEHLGLPLMPKVNSSRHDTAFTVSIEAREGVTTGISANDRARTIEAAIDESTGAEAITTPGHIFPLVARDGGVLVRAGHTEAAVDIARLAGMKPYGVICEIMKDDGTMARLPDLVEFGREHGLKIATIADLISYRLKRDRLVRKVSETQVESAHGGLFKMAVYESVLDGTEHIALVKGDVSGEEPVLVRMHAVNIVSDLIGDIGGGKAGVLQKAMLMIENEGRGVVVILRQPEKSGISEIMREREQGIGSLRNYGIGAQILLDIGVSRMILLTSQPKAPVGIEGYGLEIAGYKEIA